MEWICFCAIDFEGFRIDFDQKNQNIKVIKYRFFLSISPNQKLWRSNYQKNRINFSNAYIILKT